jgi:hypothetical protein
MADEKPASTARYAIWYVLALLVLLLLFQYYGVPKQSLEISYSEFRHLLDIKELDLLELSIVWI